MERLTSLKQKTEAASYAEVTKRVVEAYERLVRLAESGEGVV
jgi:hypothetical protein